MVVSNVLDGELQVNDGVDIGMIPRIAIGGGHQESEVGMWCCQCWWIQEWRRDIVCDK